MGLFFAFVLIGLPALALLYDFRKGGDNAMLMTAGGRVRKPVTTDPE
jgi:hypothetical protein